MMSWRSPISGTTIGRPPQGLADRWLFAGAGQWKQKAKPCKLRLASRKGAVPDGSPSKAVVSATAYQKNIYQKKVVFRQRNNYCLGLKGEGCRASAGRRSPPIPEEQLSLTA